MTIRIKKHLFDILGKIIFVLVLATSAYYIGTFLPNDYALRDFEERKEHEFAERFQAFTSEPSFEYTDNKTFIQAVYSCINYLNYTHDKEYRVPTAIIASMAIIESAYGTSRFATEGNALFGLRTWDLDNVPHMKPLAIPNAKFGVKKYKTKCESVDDMINNINNHPAYELFRVERHKQLQKGFWNYEKLVQGLKAWSVNSEYTKMILQTIKDNNLR
jgi:hypothetical protein